MTAFKHAAFKRTIKPAAALIALATVFASGAARADSGWLWLDSVFALPQNAAPQATPGPQSAAPVRHVARRSHPVRSVAATTAPRPILVSSVASESRSSCFWCNRPVYVSGLSF